MKENGFDHPLINFLVNDIHLNFNGTTIFKDQLEDETGVLTQNLVFTKPKEKFIPAIESYIKQYGLKAKVDAIEDSVYVPKDSELIKKIMNVYQETTGDLKAVH
ncbi:hypothetical protein FQA39_LY12833 [Lamprigera yunnana]|nr:hypothetical protein FQA39_LY12833 [Lamprigera yunnana]